MLYSFDLYSRSKIAQETSEFLLFSISSSNKSQNTSLGTGTLMHQVAVVTGFFGWIGVIIVLVHRNTIIAGYIWYRIASNAGGILNFKNRIPSIMYGEVIAGNWSYRYWTSHEQKYGEKIWHSNIQIAVRRHCFFITIIYTVP